LDNESPDLLALRKRLEEEESAYSRLLSTLDALASFSLPAERLPDLPAQLARLNELWPASPPPEGGGLAGRRRRALWADLAPFLERQAAFNATVVQILNGHVDETARLNAHLREIVAALVRYLQKLLPVVDARDRLSSALSTTRAELILEAFDRRLESLGRRLQGLLALGDRVEALSEEVRALRASLAAPPSAPAAAAAERAAADSGYVAFENRFRGSREEIRERLLPYVGIFKHQDPVVDLGCGRGEFLTLLREASIPARGVEANAVQARRCVDLGLDVVQGDLLTFLRGLPEAGVGGILAAQVAEHLPPGVLQEMLRESHRVLRRGGLLVLETVNPRSVVGFLEIYNRDLTHERPLHPETLSFLAAAAGFGDVRVELRSPVDPAARLQPVPGEGLPARFVEALDENLRKLNELLYGPQEYALFARRS
jgi:O-antigen chain-terminating methyltransferase